MVTAKVITSAFQKIQPLLLLFFIILSVVLTVMCLVLSTRNINLQNRLLEDRSQKIEVIMDTQELAHVLAKNYSKDVVTREIIYEKVKGDTETIVKHDTVFLNVCISDDGMQHYNDFVSSPITGKSD